MTQEELAEKLNVSRQAVAKWESGQVYPDILNTLKKYSWKPGVSKDVIEYCDKVRDALESIK